MQNILSTDSCQAFLYVSRPANLKKLDIQCTGECEIYYSSQDLSIDTMSVSGSTVEMNVVDMTVGSLSVTSQKGRTQLNQISFTGNVTINMAAGDAIIQSTNEFQLNLTHSLPAYCFAAPYYGVT